MIIFCLDTDCKNEEIFKQAFKSGNISVQQFYFNPKSIEEHFFPDSCNIVVFIDTRINIKGKNGFYLAMHFREHFPKCHIIFTSLFPEDMPYCFKNLIRPSGFLLKPITASEIALALIDINQHEIKNRRHNTIPIVTREYKYNIEISKIIYFSTIGKKLSLKMTNGKILEFYGTISKLEKEYDIFLRCHSGFLVNKMYVKGIKKGELELIGCKETLPISKKYRGIIKEHKIFI